MHTNICLCRVFELEALGNHQLTRIPLEKAELISITVEKIDILISNSFAVRLRLMLITPFVAR